MQNMFGCRVTLISEKRRKGRRLLMQTNTPSVNFFFWGGGRGVGGESLFSAGE